MKLEKAMLNAVFSVMCDGRWRALFEIHALLDGHYSESGIGSRLRDLRLNPYAAQFGVERVERRIRTGRLHEYRIVLREKQMRLIA